MHFELRRTGGISLPDHGAKSTVPRKLGISSNKQVAKVGRAFYVAGYRVDLVDKTLYFLDGIGYQHGLKIIAIP